MTSSCPPPRFLSRRFLVLGALAIPAASWAAAARTPIVTMLGDSITAGLGVSRDQAVPAQLQLALARLGRPATVRAAGVSGDTSAAGLARVDFSVQSDTALCVVALGGNDLLQGIAPAVTKANLSAIIDRLKARKIRVVLAGQSAPIVLGGDFAREFNAIFPALAKAKGVGLYPDLLAGARGDRQLMQADGIHPSPAGAALIASRLAPVVARALG
ncbi:MAG: lipolytic protein family [Caulobacteraceae bacterium]|nr:lipolytic protein family [Caulobacteraceae bacterium]